MIHSCIHPSNKSTRSIAGSSYDTVKIARRRKCVPNGSGYELIIIKQVEDDIYWNIDLQQNYNISAQNLSRSYFIHFQVWTVLYFDSNVTEICSNALMDSKPVMVQIMVCSRRGNLSLSDQMMI